MTRKIVTLLTLCILCVCCAVGFAACNGLNTNGCVGCGSNSSKIDETVSDDLEPFDYTKTDNSLTINDIKDKTVKKIILPEETTAIGKGAFKDCTNLITIVIGDNVADIEDGAFQNCDNLDAVYYKGTEETWNGIAVGENNEDLISAHTYYYSEVYPENFAEDTYWHYDGNNAVIWTIKVEHTHEYTKIVEPPTCTAQGYTTFTCTRCGDSYIDNYTDKIPHNYGWTTTKEPTETENGIKTGVCIRCGDTITEPIPALSHEHNYVEIVIAPTCTTDGYILHQCDCGDEYITDEVPARHIPANAVQENYVAPDCVNSGSYDSVVYCSTCGEELSRETIVIPATGVHNYVNGVCSVCGAEEYDCIYFGVYPQSDVTAAKGAELSTYVQTKPTNGNNNGWTSYHYLGYIAGSDTTDFMWYKDVDVDNNGTKDYRAVYFTSYRPWETGRVCISIDSIQDDNGYYTSNVYWFKFEPIKWRILSEKGNTAIILAELILDNQDYNYSGSTRTINNQTVQANNYEYSSIRAWLNDNFYNTAFNEYEKAVINTIEVDNSARSTNPDNDATYWNYGSNSYACDNTYDKVWLLSLQEATTAEYGFAESPTAYDTLRQKKTSAYAQCQGAYTNNYGGDYDGNGSWALRSPHYSYQYVNHSKSVLDDGRADGSGDADYLEGVVPALQISLSPKPQTTPDEYFIFTPLDDGTYSIQAKEYEDMPAEVILPSKYNGKPVSNIGQGAFFDCSSLKSIKIPDSVKVISEDAFISCSNLKNIEVDSNNLNYTSIDGNLYSKDGKTLLIYAIGKTETEFTVPDNVTSIGEGAFYRCSRLTSITIPGSVMYIGDGAFQGCVGLTSITFEENSNLTSIGEGAFYYCTGLKSITIGSQLTSIGEAAFLACLSLKSINVDSNNQNYKSIDGNLYSKDGKILIQYAVAKTNTAFTIPDGVISIGDYAFAGCSRLTKVNIPDSVTSIGAGAFSMSGLTSIIIPDRVISIGYYAFSECSSLTSIMIPDSVTSIGHGALEYCRSLTDVTIGNGITNIESSMFAGCSSLASIIIPDSVKRIGYDAFRDCPCINNINGIGYVDKWIVQVDYEITNINIKEDVVGIGDNAIEFFLVSNISVDSNNAYYKSIDGNLYSKDGKTLIKYAAGKTAAEFTIPDSVVIIGWAAFFDSYNLESIIIPNSVNSIEDSAFYSCFRLKNITFNGTEAQWNAIEKGDYWNDVSNPAKVVHCTDGDVEI